MGKQTHQGWDAMLHTYVFHRLPNERDRRTIYNPFDLFFRLYAARPFEQLAGINKKAEIARAFNNLLHRLRDFCSGMDDGNNELSRKSIHVKDKRVGKELTSGSLNATRALRKSTTTFPSLFASSRHIGCLRS